MLIFNHLRILGLINDIKCKITKNILTFVAEFNNVELIVIYYHEKNCYCTCICACRHWFFIL